jgi:lipoate-protein ligase A
VIQLYRRSFPGRSAFDTAVSRALLQGVAQGAPESLRLYAADDALAFSVLDRTRPGFARAVEAARQAGFEPIVRLAGGRAAVFHRGTVAFAWSQPAADPRLGIRRRFDAMADLAAAALRRMGVDARVGEVPGEYCPGAHSVNARGRTKLVGIGQRVIRGAAHVGGVVVVREASRVREALVPVYRELELPFDVDTVGSLEDEIGGVTTDDVVEALANEFGRRGALVDADLDDATLCRAAELEAEHRAGPAVDPALQRGERGVEKTRHGGRALGPAAG